MAGVQTAIRMFQQFFNALSDSGCAGQQDTRVQTAGYKVFFEHEAG